MGDALIGQSLGRYHILEKLGEGGMATVYKAYDTRLETDVAVKVIRTENLTIGGLERALKRFEREAKSLARLTHPNIVKTTDYGEYDGRPYLVMPYLPGGTLKQRLGKPMAWEESFRLLIPIGRALHYAHEQGVIHRDIKPSNIMITQSGEPMLTDFGIAKTLLDTEQTADLTGTGMGVGTPEYMSPEQFQGRGVDVRTDVYSLGVVLYEMLTGRKPYQADTPAAILVKQATDPLPRAKQYVPGLPQVVENLLLKALAKDPADRIADMAALVKAMEDVLSGKPPAQNKAISRRREKLVRGQQADREKIVLRFSRSTGIIVGLIVLGIILVAILYPSMNSVGSASPGTRMPVEMFVPQITPTGTPGLDGMTDAHGVSMRLVTAGEFTMGSTFGDPDERPVHTVYLDAFYMDKFEVTNANYKVCVDAGVCDPPKDVKSYSVASYYGNPSFEKYPVVNVDWEMARTYCEWRGGELPSEAQWEKAARGESGRVYPWWNAFNGNLANFCDRNCPFDWANAAFDDGYVDTAPVGSYPGGASQYGLYDLAGNVWEWVADWYDKDYYASSPATNPKGPASGTSRVLRGGSWGYDEDGLRSASREDFVPSLSDDNGGFRCARSINDPLASILEMPATSAPPELLRTTP